MPSMDSQALSSGSMRADALDCDVCIIGSGPAGSTIAQELSASSLRVTLLESGGFFRQEHVDAFNEIESVGWPRVIEQWSVRNRVVGGSSHTWTGRCGPFDEIDLQKRDWIPYSGWPIAFDDLAPYLDRSASYLGLGIGNGFSDDRFWHLAGHKVPQSTFDAATLLPFFWQYSRDAANPYDYMRFGRHLVSRLGSNVTLLTNATVVRLNTVASGSAIASVDFASVDGQIRTLAAPIVVLCAGGIENARLLLSSDNVIQTGLGNQHDMVGRFLMDHPRGPVARFNYDSQMVLNRFGFYKARGYGNHLFQHGMRLSPTIQRNEQLLNCAAWISEAVAEDDPWHALKRFLRGKANLRADSLTILSNAGLFVRGLNDYFIMRKGLPRKTKGLSLDCMCEQWPNPDSRLTLAERRDRLGMRLSRIDWRVHPEESRTMRRIAEVAVAQFHRMGLPIPVFEEWVRDGALLPSTFLDIAHPTGTTRMADDPTCSVVDANCQVHGVQGLFVAGSSIFPTDGHCNPTQMIVALSLRLADTLKARASAETWRGVAPQPAPHPDPIGGLTRVLVTGGAGRIGRHVVAQLIEQGYAVRALTSKLITGSEPLAAHVEWQQCDFHQSVDFDPVVTDCAAVVHLAADLGDQHRMPRVNVEATRALAAASERAGVKVFCYTSSVAVYGSGRRQRLISEESPVLTTARDVRNEYWANETLRCYGRTKLLGEAALHEVASAVEYIVLRPTVVVDVADLIALRTWGPIRKSLAARRHAHHIYVRDVADAIVWFVVRGLQRKQPIGTVSTFNLAEDELTTGSYADFFKRAYAASHDARYRVVSLPWQADWLRAFLQFRSLPFRQPLGRLIFSNSKLRTAGYKPRFGMATALELAVAELQNPTVGVHGRSTKPRSLSK